MSNFSEAVRQMLQDTAECPACGEVNKPGQKALVEVNEQYRGYCGRCGKDFVAERRRAPRERPR